MDFRNSICTVDTNVSVFGSIVQFLDRRVALDLSHEDSILKGWW